MPKKKIKVWIQNDNQTQEEEVIALVQKDKIHYIAKDETKTTYHREKNVLIRQNNELEMEYLFIENQRTNGKLRIKEMNKYLEIPIYTKKIIQKKNSIEIIYIIEKEEYKYRIEEII